jgi:hypothetical protein
VDAVGHGTVVELEEGRVTVKLELEQGGCELSVRR